MGGVAGLVLERVPGERFVRNTAGFQDVSVHEKDLKMGHILERGVKWGNSRLIVGHFGFERDGRGVGRDV